MKGIREWSESGFAAYRQYFVAHSVFSGKDVSVRKKAPSFPFTPQPFRGRGGKHNFRGGAVGVRAFRGFRG